ncbi:MAG: SGNH/GDSL hydrolase family protein [Gallionellaceae bacterium]
MPNSSIGVTVISPDQLKGNGNITKPGAVFSWDDYERHYLAEGDSWFSLSDLLSPSFLYRFGHNVPLGHSTLIVNCSYPGDTLARMVDWSKNVNFSNLLARQNFGWEWDGVLLSAGGNDIIEASLSPAGILQTCANPASSKDFIDSNAMSILENHLKDYFQYLVSLRDTSEIVANRTRPIFFHTYGYPTPRNAPASVSGPWLYKAFKQMNIPNQYWNDLSDALMDELADMLRSFASMGSNLRLVDTLKNVNLIRADANDTGSSGDWLNEIHLNDSGKDKVATYWATFL